MQLLVADVASQEVQSVFENSGLQVNSNNFLGVEMQTVGNKYWWFRRISIPTDQISDGQRICRSVMVIGDDEDWICADSDLSEPHARLMAASPALLRQLKLARQMCFANGATPEELHPMDEAIAMATGGNAL